jgi:hypothetical protein
MSACDPNRTLLHRRDCLVPRRLGRSHEDFFNGTIAAFRDLEMPDDAITAQPAPASDPLSRSEKLIS